MVLQLIRECFPPRSVSALKRLLRNGFLLVQAEDVSQFRGPGEGEKLELGWSSQGSRYFIQIGQWVQTVQLINLLGKGNLDSLCLSGLVIGKQDTYESYPSHMGKAVNFQNTKTQGDNYLTITVFEECRAWVKFNTVSWRSWNTYSLKSAKTW